MQIKLQLTKKNQKHLQMRFKNPQIQEKLVASTVNEFLPPN